MADAARLAAEAPVLGANRAARAADVENRGEVHVDADAVQAFRRLRPLTAAVALAPPAHLLGRRVRRPGKALHQPALLVDHDQQRAAQPLRLLDPLELADQAPGVATAAEVLVEQHDAGELSGTDHPLDLVRGAATREAADDPLPGQLRNRELVGAGLPLRLPVGQRDPDRGPEGRDREQRGDPASPEGELPRQARPWYAGAVRGGS
jgi:hypothetical protein